MYPNDKVIVGDAHDYLLQHYKEFDFIWSSPPCPTHSDIRRCGVHANQYAAVYPAKELWEEIILLKHFSKCPWMVENVKTYYKPFIELTFKLDRHYFWSNFNVSSISVKARENTHCKMNGSSTIHGFNLDKYDIKNKRQLLRNLVNPIVGQHILNEAKL